MPFTVAIIGRPNVGKSTLFNRLAGRKLAIVDDTPGVTRDRREAPARLGDLRFTVIDTAGLEEAFDDSMEGRMRAQTDRAVEAADVALLMIDARAGLTPLDAHFARWLRGRAKPTLLVANKCEGGAGAAGLYETYALGLGEPIALSAEHGEGLADLYDALRPYADAAAARGAGPAPETGGGEAGDDEADPTISLAIVGRPNVGKSTLVNRLLGEDRMLTGPEAGITRDSIAIPWSYRGRPVRLVDTAGLRRKSRVEAKLETLAVEDSLRAMRYAQCVVLMVDALAPLEKQDLTIAGGVVDEGRALVLAVNKWDRVRNRGPAMRTVRDRLETSLPQARGIPVVPLSALSGEGVEKLMPAVLAVVAAWNRRIPTSQLNRWLAEVTDRHPPPMARGRRLRLRYMTQAKTRPPTFALFANLPKDVPESYLRYLANGLREAFDMPGVPLRIKPRKAGRNPFADGG